MNGNSLSSLMENSQHSLVESKRFHTVISTTTLMKLLSALSRHEPPRPQTKKIKALRTQFLKRLKDTFGIDIKHNDYDNIPLAGEIDLGGRGKIVSYVVNENANQRTMTKRGSSITSSMPPASRLHEVGFRLVVGRAGISTNDGTLPFGSMILEGLYILEDSIAGDLEIEFHSIGPIQLNGWSTAVVYNHLFNDALGEGRFSAMVPLASVSKDGIRVKVRGVLVFGNLDLDD